MSSISLQFLPCGNPLPMDLLSITRDAIRAINVITDIKKKNILEEKLRNALNMTWDMVIVRYGDVPIGLISVKSTGSDVFLPFGHIMPAYDKHLQDIVNGMIKLLIGRGFTEIRSLFNWPEAGPFARAAIAAGFDHIERMDMTRENGELSVHIVPPKDIEIVRWSSKYFDDVARIMFENYQSEDRILNPRSNSIEGCRSYLSDIVTNTYDTFLPGKSFIAIHEGKPVGYLLMAALPPDIAVIYDLAVERRFRGRGIGSILIQHLIRDNSGEKGHILLTVTKSNQDAIRLYEKMGFQAVDSVTYYIFKKVIY